jgi:hypothetical protein
MIRSLFLALLLLPACGSSSPSKQHQGLTTVCPDFRGLYQALGQMRATQDGCASLTLTMVDPPPQVGRPVLHFPADHLWRAAEDRTDWGSEAWFTPDAGVYVERYSDEVLEYRRKHLWDSPVNVTDIYEFTRQPNDIVQMRARSYKINGQLIEERFLQIPRIGD